jgi:hypothetical protein
MEKLTEEKFIEIMDREYDHRIEGDNTLRGLIIMSGYIDRNNSRIIKGADHDVIYGPQIDTLIEAGITEEDVDHLNQNGWFIEDDGLQHFV